MARSARVLPRRSALRLAVLLAQWVSVVAQQRVGFGFTGQQLPPAVGAHGLPDTARGHLARSNVPATDFSKVTFGASASEQHPYQHFGEQHQQMQPTPSQQYQQQHGEANELEHTRLLQLCSDLVQRAQFIEAKAALVAAAKTKAGSAEVQKYAAFLRWRMGLRQLEPAELDEWLLGWRGSVASSESDWTEVPSSTSPHRRGGVTRDNAIANSKENSSLMRWTWFYTVGVLVLTALARLALLKATPLTSGQCTAAALLQPQTPHPGMDSTSQLNWVPVTAQQHSQTIEKDPSQVVDSLTTTTQAIQAASNAMGNGDLAIAQRGVLPTQQPLLDMALSSHSANIVRRDIALGISDIPDDDEDVEEMEEDICRAAINDEDEDFSNILPGSLREEFTEPTLGTFRPPLPLRAEAATTCSAQSQTRPEAASADVLVVKPGQEENWCPTVTRSSPRSQAPVATSALPAVASLDESEDEWEDLRDESDSVVCDPTVISPQEIGGEVTKPTRDEKSSENFGDALELKRQMVEVNGRMISLYDLCKEIGARTIGDLGEDNIVNTAHGSSASAVAMVGVEAASTSATQLARVEAANDEAKAGTTTSTTPLTTTVGFQGDSERVAEDDHCNGGFEDLHPALTQGDHSVTQGGLLLAEMGGEEWGWGRRTDLTLEEEGALAFEGHRISHEIAASWTMDPGAWAERPDRKKLNFDIPATQPRTQPPSSSSKNQALPSKGMTLAPKVTSRKDQADEAAGPLSEVRNDVQTAKGHIYFFGGPPGAQRRKGEDKAGGKVEFDDVGKSGRGSSSDIVGEGKVARGCLNGSKGGPKKEIDQEDYFLARPTRYRPIGCYVRLPGMGTETFLPIEHMDPQVRGCTATIREFVNSMGGRVQVRELEEGVVTMFSRRDLKARAQEIEARHRLMEENVAVFRETYDAKKWLTGRISAVQNNGIYVNVIEGKDAFIPIDEFLEKYRSFQQIKVDEAYEDTNNNQYEDEHGRDEQSSALSKPRQQRAQGTSLQHPDLQIGKTIEFRVMRYSWQSDSFLASMLSYEDSQTKRRLKQGLPVEGARSAPTVVKPLEADKRQLYLELPPPLLAKTQQTDKNLARLAAKGFSVLNDAAAVELNRYLKETTEQKKQLKPVVSSKVVGNKSERKFIVNFARGMNPKVIGQITIPTKASEKEIKDAAVELVRKEGELKSGQDHKGVTISKNIITVKG